VDLVERAGDLKPMLVDFAMSPRFDRELSAVIARNFPDGVVTDESVFRNPAKLSEPHPAAPCRLWQLLAAFILLTAAGGAISPVKALLASRGQPAGHGTLLRLLTAAALTLTVLSRGSRPPR
jgi:hypothetical protein